MTKPILALLGLLLALAGCGGAASDGRYATHDRGRSNNRAEAPLPAVALEALR